MRTAPSQAATSVLGGDSLQLNLRTLLAGVTLATSLCAVGIYTGSAVTAAVCGTVVISGTIGAAMTKSREGFLRGAAYGFHLTLLAILLTTAHSFYKEWVHVGGTGRQLTASPMRRSPAETFQAIQSVVPSAHGLPEDARIEDVLCGHYDRSGDLAGSEIYVFPDNTYVYVEWADILPLTILDQGTWNYRDGVLFMHTDGSIPGDIKFIDDRYLPLMAITQGLLTRNVVRKDRVLLLSANLYTELRLDAAIGRGDVDRLLSMRSFLQTEKISADEIKAIKDRLYTNWAPDVPRWPAEGALVC